MPIDTFQCSGGLSFWNDLIFLSSFGNYYSLLISLDMINSFNNDNINWALKWPTYRTSLAYDQNWTSIIHVFPLIPETIFYFSSFNYFCCSACRLRNLVSIYLIHLPNNTKQQKNIHGCCRSFIYSFSFDARFEFLFSGLCFESNIVFTKKKKILNLIQRFVI